MYQVTLTDDQRTILEMYIRITTQFRHQEQDACQRMGEELDEDGNQRYPNQAANAVWWQEAEAELQGVLAALDAAEQVKEETK